MTERAILVVEVDQSAKQGNNDLVIGRVWLSLGDLDFPERGWPDFVVRVVRWWVEATTDLATGRAAEATVRFMDGPYRIELSRCGASDWRLRLVEERQSGDFVRAEAVADAYPLVGSVVAAFDGLWAELAAVPSMIASLRSVRGDVGRLRCFLRGPDAQGC